MKKQEQIKGLTDLLHGNLSPEKEEEIIAFLERSGMSRKEINSIRKLSDLTGEQPTPGPSEKMDRRFYAMLGEEKNRALLRESGTSEGTYSTLPLLMPGLRIAAGIALFLLGWFTSGWFGPSNIRNTQMADLSVEVKQLKETLVLTMMHQNSTGARIKAVNMAGELDSPDNRIIESLIGVLNNDSNDNVRLLALDALIRYSTVPEVRDGMIASIGNQTSPLVQLRLAEIMLALNEKRAAPEFLKVLQNPGLNYSVRNKMNEALGLLQ